MSAGGNEYVNAAMNAWATANTLYGGTVTATGMWGGNPAAGFVPPTINPDWYKQVLDAYGQSGIGKKADEKQPQQKKEKKRLIIMEEQVKALLDAGKALGQGMTLLPEGERTVSIIPDGYEVTALEQYVEKYLPAPRRTKADVSLNTTESFIRYVTEHKKPETRIFVACAPGASPVYRALIDFIGPDKPSWVEHRAFLNLRFTEPWKAWTQRNCHHFNQTEFAGFIETNGLSIASPNGADMLELIQTLEGTSNARYTAATRLSNGKTKFAYEEDVNLKGSTGTTPGAVDFPTELILGLAPFEDGPSYRVVARLRYRLGSGKLTFWYELVEIPELLRAAMKDINAILKKELGIAPLEGTYDCARAD